MSQQGKIALEQKNVSLIDSWELKSDAVTVGRLSTSFSCKEQHFIVSFINKETCVLNFLYSCPS